MEITIAFLKSLTPDDIRKIGAYQKLLAEAEEAVKAVIGKYKFSIGQDKITLWSDGNNAEYLTHNGIWQARYLHQTYGVRVTVEDIFEIFKEQYEYKSNGPVNIKAESADYFRTFVSKCKSTEKGGAE